MSVVVAVCDDDDLAVVDYHYCRVTSAAAAAVQLLFHDVHYSYFPNW